MFNSKVTDQVIKKMEQTLIKEGINLNKDYKKRYRHSKLDSVCPAVMNTHSLLP